MTTLLALLLQVGPPVPVCTESQPMPIGAPVPCVGGWLVPRADIAADAVRARECRERITAERRAADARVESCSAAVELAHAGMNRIADIFEAGQADDTARLLEVEAPACPWYECPGWTLAGGLGIAVGGAVVWAVLR